MGTQKIVIEAIITGNATDQKLWEQSCPTILNRRLVEVRAIFTGAGKLKILRETDEQWAAEKTLLEQYKREDVVDVAWEAGVTLYLYGTDTSGAANAVKVALFYEELPV